MPSRPRRINLYPRNATARLDAALFASPTREYRGTPFWAWNNRLDRRQLIRQIGWLQQMGFGGFHIHARTGLATAYLGEDFLACVRACVDEAERRDLLAWLYDEDRWPSGFAGGLVTADASLREKFLRWSVLPSHGGVSIGRYHVVLEAGRLASYRRLREAEVAPLGTGTLWHASLETSGDDSWFNGTSYADTFQRRAIERFIEVTHERYAAAIGDRFGRTVPAIFTDEPHFLKKQSLERAESTSDVLLPFTDDFLDSYARAYDGQRLEDHLPELFWERGDGVASLVRYRYHDHTAERFASAFSDTLGDWCGRHGIALTGHMLSEQTLHGQSRAVGEVMRGLRSFQLPGIDLLQDKFEFTTAKQAQSVARQFSRPGVLSELYGVTNWDFDFAGFKRQGDWQAAMGVTVRVPHLAWVSMAGEAKRDYPASIFRQSPWWDQWPIVEDHFARLNTVLTRGTPAVRVAVIHPIESFWLAWGPIDQTAADRARQEKQFQDVTAWLSHGLIDFDFIAESLLPTQSPRVEGQSLVVGAMRYDAIVVPPLNTIRATTLAVLDELIVAGGTVVAADAPPTLVDAVESDAAEQLASRAMRFRFEREPLLAALAPFRDLDVIGRDGLRPDGLLYQLRADGPRRHLFLCNSDRDRPRSRLSVRLTGRFSATSLDTHTGAMLPIDADVSDTHTTLDCSLAAHGHLLLTLDPVAGDRKAANTTPAPAPAPAAWVEVARLESPVPVTLSEPNALLLDQAEWKLDRGAWQPREELLRIDNHVRRSLGLPTRGGKIAQPYTDRDDAPPLATLMLRFTIHCDVAVSKPRLAIEPPRDLSLSLDGKAVTTRPRGRWVDEAIRTVPLPSLRRGTHTLVLTIPFTRRTDIEWCYLLGDFGVALAGTRATLTAPVRSLGFGDWTTQGLPFYTGNVTYHCTLRGDGRAMRLAFPKFRNPLLRVHRRGAQASVPVAFAPFEADLGVVGKAAKVDIVAYGHRGNAFGPVHHTNESLNWVGPAAWWSEGANWSYEYVLKRMGVLSAPIVLARP